MKRGVGRSPGRSPYRLAFVARLSVAGHESTDGHGVAVESGEEHRAADGLVIKTIPDGAQTVIGESAGPPESVHHEEPTGCAVEQPERMHSHFTTSSARQNRY